MSGNNSAARAVSAEAVRLQTIIDDPGTHRVGEKTIQDNNGALMAVLPKPFSEMMGAQKGDDCTVYVNLEKGIVIHKITGGGDGAE